MYAALYLSIANRQINVERKTQQNRHIRNAPLGMTTARNRIQLSHGNA